MNGPESNKVNLFEQFVDRYSPSVFSAIATLTGLSDKKDLGTMTANVFVDLWKSRDELFKEIRPVAFIYKILLQHVFTYLKAQGNEDRILLLRKILLIDPSYYMDILEPKDGHV